ncbi:MAG: cation diffusion facilitator family transporter [Mycobacteriales bacterium]
MSASGGKAAVVAALLANAGIAVSKFVAFAFTGSSSMLAESVHSVADTGNQGLLLLGGRRAEREADEQHPFGYGMDRYFYAFVVALVLFSVGALFALYEGYEKLRHPHELESPLVAIGVLLVAMALEAFSFRTAYRESVKVKPAGMSWPGFIRHSKNPELPVVLLEDTAALLGLIFALAGVSLTLLFDEPRWDGVGTLAIGVLLGAVAFVLAVEMKSLLIGEAASPPDVEAIRTALVDGEVTRVIHLRTVHIGPEEVLVAAKVAFRPDADMADVARGINAAEARVRAAVPLVSLMYLEPDLYRADLAKPV